MKAPFIAQKQTYLSEDKETTWTVFHPAILFERENDYCFFPDESTKTGLVEHENEKDALKNAEELYNHFVLKE